MAASASSRPRARSRRSSRSGTSSSRSRDSAPRRTRAPPMSDFLADAERFLPLLVQGLYLTVATTICSLALSTAIGFLWAVMRWSKIAPLSIASQTAVTVIRGIPLIVQLFYIYFVLPDIVINLTAFEAGIIGLGIGYSAYQPQNFRA